MSLSRQGSPASMRGSSSGGTENRHKRKCVLNQHLAQTSVYGWPVWMRKPLGIFAFTNLFYEESEWQLVSESLSAEAYVGFLFPCYSTPIYLWPRETAAFFFGDPRTYRTDSMSGRGQEGAETALMRPISSRGTGGR